MRKPVLPLAVFALVFGACSGSAGAPAASSGHRDPAPPQHHVATAPPRPQPPADDGSAYIDPPVAPYVDPEEDEVSTFGLDVDTASYTIAQRAVDEGGFPDPATVRVEEWVNAFDQGYEPPLEDTFAIVADGGPTPFIAQDEVLLRVGLQARDVRNRARDDAALTFVIDTSGSMAQDGRLELVKDSLRVLVDRLGDRDRVSIVTFGDEARVVLPPTWASDSGRIIGSIEELWPGGSTNLEAGLRLGYELARETLTEDGIDRVVLASDGVANVGLTEPEEILGRIREDASAGIELVSVGVGMGDYNDVLLEQLADQGDGFYAYVNELDEAHRLFAEDLTGTLQTVALDARAQVEFDRDRVQAYRPIGYENRAIADDDFENDEVEAGAIGAGHAVTVLYALQLSHDVGPGDRLATVRLRWNDPDGGLAREIERQIQAGDLGRSFHDTSEHLRFDALVAATAEVLRGSQWTGHLDLVDVASIADEESGSLPPTDEVHEFLRLLDQLAYRE
jgi:Ca-activated chloride channel family protein